VEVAAVALARVAEPEIDDHLLVDHANRMALHLARLDVALRAQHVARLRAGDFDIGRRHARLAAMGHGDAVHQRCDQEAHAAEVVQVEPAQVIGTVVQHLAERRQFRVRDGRQQLLGTQVLAHDEQALEFAAIFLEQRHEARRRVHHVMAGRRLRQHQQSCLCHQFKVAAHLVRLVWQAGGKLVHVQRLPAGDDVVAKLEKKVVAEQCVGERDMLDHPVTDLGDALQHGNNAVYLHMLQRNILNKCDCP
jgi:hypothetical protein